MDNNNAKNIIAENAAIVESVLDSKYGDDSEIVGGLTEAQRYSLLSGGKRIRPCLCIEACKMFGGDMKAALPFAAAIEMVHNYSLIHDDLPCMDDDDLRRGKPTTHKVYGEAVAVLAGDGLLTDAFLECAMNPYVSGDCAAVAVSLLSAATGSRGMIRGQAIDMYGETHELTLEQLIELHVGKTGALICAAVQLGCLAAGIAPDDEKMNDMTAVSTQIGLAFQIIDDVLDVTSTAETLGKPIGSDKEQNKTTFLRFFTVEQALAYAKQCTDTAVSILEKYENSDRLIAIAQLLCSREK
ncbi:MAG: polyprenyl synthetase family protein [Clostridia bacterium]|nr:polyprenyl synthetase family protein [Clostridia bacterium]